MEHKNENQETPELQQEEILKYNDPEEMKSAFKSIWTQPKVTIRKIVNTNPSYMVIWLVIISSILGTLLQSSELTSDTPLLLWLILGVPVGLVLFYLVSALYKWTGSWIGGKASHQEIRAAYAWSTVPVIVGSLIGVIQLLVMGPPVDPMEVVQNAATAVTAAFFGLVQLVFVVWSIVVFIAGLSEVHQFSAGKAVANILLVVLIAIVPIIILGVVIFILLAAIFM